MYNFKPHSHFFSAVYIHALSFSAATDEIQTHTASQTQIVECEGLHVAELQ